MFSVIIPTFNSAAKVCNAINSVLGQTFDDYEVVVVDDGSTDDTSTAVKNIKDSRVRYIYKNNGGPASARNLGIKNATFKYVCFLDADDVFLPEKLSKTFVVLSNLPTVDVIFTDALYINETTKKQYLFSSAIKIYTEKMFLSLLKGNFIVNSTVVLNKESLVQKNLHFDESNELRFVEDYDMWLQLAQRKFHFFYMNDVLTNYHIHENNNSKNTLRTFRSLFLVYKKYIFISPTAVKEVTRAYLRYNYLKYLKR